MPAKSKAQQRLFGMALAYKRGELDDVSQEVKDLANSMSAKELEKFASTKHEGFPNKKESLKLTDILHEILSETITVYRGAGDIPTKRKLKYYTPNKKYAEWFMKNASYKDTGKLTSIEVNDSEFLDLRKLGYEFTPNQFLDELDAVGLDTSKIFDWSGEAKNMLDFVWESWQIVTDDDNIWDQINKKYKGVIIKERNPEAEHLGLVDSYIIWNDA